MKQINTLIICLSIIILALCKTDFYDSHSSVINLNKKNFDTQITFNRSKNIISVVHYYTQDDGKSKGYKEEYEKFAREYEGMFKVTAMDCKEFKDLCEKQDIREYPTFMIYPSLPAPIMAYEGKIEASAMVSYLGKFMGNKALELNNNNFESFLSGNPNLPKSILFTDKKGIPLIFKALSVNFDKKIEFGVVRKEDSGITGKFKVNKFPRILMIGVDKKQKFYEGETKYKPIFEFVNVYSETFFRVGENNTRGTDSGSAANAKPWLNEKLPELTKESGNELCFKVDGVVCVILLHKDKPTEELINLMSHVQNILTPKIERGIKYKYGWLDTSKQSKFLEAAGISEEGPRLLLVNPGKRKRHYLYEGELNEEGISKMIV